MSGRRGAWLMAVAIVAAGCRQQPAAKPPPPPNVLLITIDTFRADRLGVGVAPALDRLAAASLRFMAARAAVPLTLPSHTTILTGLLPPAHGVRENGVDVLADAHPTIARLLKNAGYRTAAFVGAFVLDRRFGLSPGFDVYDDQIPRNPNATDRLDAERPAQAVVDRALAWLEHPAPRTQHPAPSTPHPAPEHPAPSTQHPAPFFAWIHLYDPHAPYTPPPQFRARTASPYDGEIAYADSQIARVLDWLHTSGEDSRTFVIVAGDHGEGLGDHGERTHGMLLYDSTLRVPLVVSAPGVAPKRWVRPVSLADIAPTILIAAGVAPPPTMHGRNLLTSPPSPPPSAPPSPSRGGDGGADLYAETEYPHVAGWAPLAALTDGRWMAIRVGTSTELYDLENDPGEQHDVAAAQATTTAALAARIDLIHRAVSTASSRTISAEAQERLRALGYVASSTLPADAAGAPNPATRIADWNAFEDALSALNAGKRDALPQLRRLAAAHPDAPVFVTTYARALKENGSVTDALTVYRSAAQKWPTDAMLLHDLAVAAREASLRSTGDAAGALRTEASRAEAAAAALSPSSAMAQNGLGLIAADENHPADAVAAFQRATRLDPNNASYWANLGNAQRAGGDAQGADRAYRRALEIDGRQPDAANGLGVLLVEAHRPAEAVPWLERAVGAAPNFVEARLNLGIALQEAGDAKRATIVYRQVLAAPARFKREREAAAKLLTSLSAVR